MARRPSIPFPDVHSDHTLVVTFSPYTLQMVGAITENLTQEQFESLAAQYPASFTDNNNAVWTGVPLWRLIALVDDSDPTTFNDSLATTYTVNIICSSYLNNAILSDNGVIPLNFPHNDYIIVANKYNGGPVPLTSAGAGGWVWAPLRLIGNSSGSGGSTFAHFGAGLIEIQLTDLPATDSNADGAAGTPTSIAGAISRPNQSLSGSGNQPASPGMGFTWVIVLIVIAVLLVAGILR